MAGVPPVGVVVALEVEARCLGVTTQSAGVIVASGAARLVIRSGMGPMRAEHGARALVAAGAVGLASIGTAAALSPPLGVGSLLVPGEILGRDGRIGYADPEWRRRLGGRLAPWVVPEEGPLAEVEGVLALPRDKARVHAATGAVACDMESAAVGRVAAAAGIPFIALRAVSDGAGTGIAACALGAVDSEGNVSVLRCLLGLLREPTALASLLESAAGFRAARRTLRRALRLTGGDLDFPRAPERGA